MVGLILEGPLTLWFMALDRTSVASAIILLAVHPFIVGVGSHLFFKERLSKLAFVCICIAFMGVILMTLGDKGQGSTNFLGDMLALISGSFLGAYIIGGSQIRKEISMITYVFVLYSVCAIVGLVGSLAAGDDLLGKSSDELLIFLLLAIVPTLLGHTMYNFALGYIKASIVSVTLLSEPITTTALAIILLNETPTIPIIIGGALILSGIMTVTRIYPVKKNRQGMNA